jgi:hypothetical protein
MKKSSTLSLDQCDGGGDDDLYFEMEFPLQPITSGLSPGEKESSAYGSRSTLDSRESPGCYSRESSLEPAGGAARERPTSLGIPLRSKQSLGDLFGSLPRTKVNRVPKISLPNYSVPGTPRTPRADPWANRNYLGNTDLSGN